MSKNDITDLRRMLFDQLEKLSDPNSNLEKEIRRAEAMVDVGRVIVDSAKAETDFYKVTGRKAASQFIPQSHQISEGDTENE